MISWLEICVFKLFLSFSASLRKHYDDGSAGASSIVVL